MSRVDEVVELLARSRRGRSLAEEERQEVARALDDVLDGRGRIKGVPGIEVLWQKPEHFEGSGRFSAIYRSILHPNKLEPQQLQDVLIDLRIHEQLQDRSETLAEYVEVRAHIQADVAEMTAKAVKADVLKRLKRIGFWNGRKRRYEGVVLIGLRKLASRQKGKPRRELRQEFLYGIEHDNLISILYGSVIEGHLVQFEEYWGYRDWRSLDLPQRIQLAIDAARGVEYLHDLNIVHRDIKPENVLVKGRKRPQAKLCDYGLIDSEDLAKYNVTKTEDGTVVGTLLYMSPEQARGQTGKSSDVFALGGLLYTYMTDEAPTPIPLNATRHEQSDQVLHRRVKPQDPLRIVEPSDKAERRLLERLSLVVAGCLQEDPDLRYPDVVTYRSDLEEVLAGAGASRLPRHVKQLRMPLDLYRDTVYSSHRPYPTDEVLAEAVEDERGGSILKLVGVFLLVLILAGAVVLQLNPRGWGDSLKERLETVAERLER